ncbi:MAG: hypothetical protein NPIRA03_13020 [Nitrospirales bacterium]|nr:MAG: hypothetical protein NPIRA03_13020 [Nitrospirales bacterium]
MGHTMDLPALKSAAAPPASIKFLGSMPETKFSFLQLVVLPDDLFLSGSQKRDSLSTGKIPNFRESRRGNQQKEEPDY